jgi:diaminopimelate epimerase
LPSGGPIDVNLPGGALTVARDPSTGETSLTGPARHVYSGRLSA